MNEPKYCNAPIYFGNELIGEIHRLEDQGRLAYHRAIHSRYCATSEKTARAESRL